MEDSRSQLERELLIAVKDLGADPDTVKSRIFLCLNQYEITRRSTEIVPYEGDAIEKFIKLFLVNKQVQGCTPRTIKMYALTLKMFFEFTRKNPCDVTSDDIKYFLAIKETRDHASKVYLEDLLRPVSSFYTWMMREEYISRNPLNKCDRIKVQKKKKKAFSDMDIAMLRKACDGKYEEMLIEMLLSTGCRVSELAGMKISEIDMDNDRCLAHGKGEKDRYVYINAGAKLALKEYLEIRKDTNPYLFPKCCVEWGKMSQYGTSKDWMQNPKMVTKEEHCDSSTIENKCRKIGKRAKVENCHPHRFRRTCATMALRKGMPIEYVSKMLGHESIETTQIYLDLNEEELAYQHRKYVS